MQFCICYHFEVLESTNQTSESENLDPPSNNYIWVSENCVYMCIPYTPKWYSSYREKVWLTNRFRGTIFSDKAIHGCITPLFFSVLGGFQQDVTSFYQTSGPGRFDSNDPGGAIHGGGREKPTWLSQLR